MIVPDVPTAEVTSGGRLGCPVCGTRRNHPRLMATAMVRSAFPGTAVVECDECRLVHIAPIPNAVEGFYEDEYFRSYREAGLSFPTEGENLHPRYAARLIAVQRSRGAGCLLEIGVGHGGFLHFARRQGWDVTGLDISKYAADYVHQRYGIGVICGTLETANLAPASFDMVHMSHVLEHLPDPLGTLCRIQRLLRPGGVLAVEVPNELNNLYVRMREVLGAAHPYPVRSTHVCFFAPGTLGRTLRLAGFDVHRLTTMRDANDPRHLRHLFKAVIGAIERPLGRGPLIEAIAVRPQVTC